MYRRKVKSTASGDSFTPKGTITDCVLEGPNPTLYYTTIHGNTKGEGWFRQETFKTHSLVVRGGVIQVHY